MTIKKILNYQISNSKQTSITKLPEENNSKCHCEERSDEAIRAPGVFLKFPFGNTRLLRFARNDNSFGYLSLSGERFYRHPV